MFLSNASVSRPVAMVCLIIALIFMGVSSFSSLGLEYLPQVDVPYITVTTVYPGASPSEIETDVGKKIEDAVGSLDGLKHITTTAVENACVTLIELNLDKDQDQAATDVREKIDLILDDLPAEAEKPSIVKFDVNAKPIVTLALTGDAPVSELYDYADNELSNRLASIPGVGEVQVLGGAEKEVQVLLDRDLVAAHGLTSTDVARAVGSGVQTVPAGWVKHHGSEFTVKYDAEYRRVEDIGNLEILNLNGARIFLKDLGKAVMTTEDQRQAAYIDGRQAISIQVVKKGQANSVAVVNQVREAVDKLKADLPGGMELVWVYDDGDFIQASAASTMSSIWMGVALTAAILFLFLYNMRLTLIVGLTMPITFTISVYFISLMGYTMNMSTLLSAGLSVGILVTNSIVVLERIVKRFERSGKAREAARLGTSDVAMAVLASAGTNLVVLFPIAIMGSTVGRVMAPFAMTMIIVTAVSLFISFTLTPILASIMLKPRKTGGWNILGRVEAWQNRGLDGLAGHYARFLGFVGQRRWLIGLFLVGVAALFYLTVTGPAKSMGFDMVANSDQGQVMVKLEYPTHYGLSQTVTRVREVERLLSGLPQLQHIQTVVGKVSGAVGTSTEGVHLAQITLVFTPKTQRSETLDSLLSLARKRLADQTGTLTTISYPTAIGGQSAPIELLISGPDLDVLDGLAQQVFTLAGGMDTVSDPDTTVRPGKPELRVVPKRAVLSDLGLPSSALGTMLRANLDGVEAGVFKRGDRSYDIRVRLSEEEGKEQIERFMLPGGPGRSLVLSALADVEEDTAPIQITRVDRQRVTKFFGYNAGRTALGSAVAQITEGIEEQISLPSGYTYRFSGVNEVLEESNREFGKAILLAVVLTYLVLAAIMESFFQPFIILTTVPLAFVGIIWGLYAFDENISIFVMVGGVMLIGIVVNNAILMAERRKQLLAEGASPREAVVNSAADQLRPIIMITLAAILGMLPLAVGQGLGSEGRVGIGIASIGGIAVSAVLTMVMMPLLYQLFLKKEPKENKEEEKSQAD